MTALASPATGRTQRFPAVGAHVALRTPEMQDYEAWAELRSRSSAFLKPWEPTWPADDLTRMAFRKRIKGYERHIAEGRAMPMFMFRKTDGVLVGGVTLSNIRRGAALAGTLGYWIGQPYARRGYASDGVRIIVKHSFGVLGLHRVEAACLATNTPSRRLLTRCGFQEEGVARRYLKINGAWRDHVLYARLDDDPEPRAS